MTEQWAPIPGWADLYEASSKGRIRSLDRQFVDRAGRRGACRGRVLAAAINVSTGRRSVTLCRDARRTHRAVHQLILETFVGPRPSGMCGCHNDGDPLNNKVTNLRWDTPSSNMLDKLRHRTDPHANQTHCVNGHEFTPENTRVQQRPETGRMRRTCRTCIHEKARAYETKVRALRPPVARHPVDQPGVNAAKTHCRHGHEYTPENTRFRRTGGRACRECSRLRGRMPDLSAEVA